MAVLRGCSVMNTFRRSGNHVFIGEEQFALSDVLSVVPDYPFSRYGVHYYNGKKHYVSDGETQLPCETPCLMVENLFERLPELRMCRSQRESDHKYFENIRNGRR